MDSMNEILWIIAVICYDALIYWSQPVHMLQMATDGNSLGASNVVPAQVAAFSEAGNCMNDKRVQFVRTDAQRCHKHHVQELSVLETLFFFLNVSKDKSVEQQKC